MAFGRAWQASWWEWHVLMAVAFAAIVLASRREYRRSRSMRGAFGGIYVDRTLERPDGRQSAAMAELVRADADGTVAAAADRLRARGFTGDQGRRRRPRSTSRSRWSPPARPDPRRRRGR